RPGGRHLGEPGGSRADRCRARRNVGDHAARARQPGCGPGYLTAPAIRLRRPVPERDVAAAGRPRSPPPAPAMTRPNGTGRGTARPVREYRRSRGDRVGDAIFSVLARAGVGPAHLLTTRGRKTGRARTNPVIPVVQGRQRWLVAPYGAVPWVLNAHAAGQVRL